MVHGGNSSDAAPVKAQWLARSARSRCISADPRLMKIIRGFSARLVSSDDRLTLNGSITYSDHRSFHERPRAATAAEVD